LKDINQTNRDFWNELTDIHCRSQFYGLDEFKQGVQTLHDVELELLGNVEGKSILHLQCHFGLGVLCWLHDLPAWAKVVSHFVNVGGTFVLVEEHPLLSSWRKKARQTICTSPTIISTKALSH
jgi:hypothetical protein